MSQLRISFVLAGLLALIPALAAPPAKSDAGFEWSVEQGTQFNFGELGIGVGSVLKGPYIDENKQQQYGLYASLEISVEGQPSAFQQADVHDGQILLVGGYRILVEQVLPHGNGVVILRIWGPSTDR